MKIFLLWVLTFFLTTIYAAPQVETGAMQLPQYLPLLEHQRVGLFANHTSFVGTQHLLEVLLAHHVNVVKIFAPEHGFYGDRNTRIQNSVDMATGIPIVSLYGKKAAPTAADLKNVDVLLFDIQDVGVRFYTYISSLQKLMEAAVKNNKPLIILDRPNPNGFYVDGPVLAPQCRSFTGMQPVPIVYGMTIGEYAKMLVGEEWLDVKPKSSAKKLKLTVIPCRNYTHQTLYVPPIKPSPGLPNIQSIYWYPSVGLMEATVLSWGSGTATPFQIFGHPYLSTPFSFSPNTLVARFKPRFYKSRCQGWSLVGDPQAVLQKINGQLQLQYLIAAYRLYPVHLWFFDDRHLQSGFRYMAGNDALEAQIKLGLDAAEIRKSWQPQLDAFKKIRAKYLLYP